jgi:hypothetical protein
MSLDPVIGNSLSNTCGDLISSNCITWAGGAVNGLCGGATLTQVVQQAVNNSNTAVANSGCCEGSFPAGGASCYTGDWVDFFSSIPSTGSSGGASWTIVTPGAGFGSGTGVENNPQYKWTTQGDLKIRGSFIIQIGPIAAPSVFMKIPLVTIPTTCFPTGWTATQSAIIGADGYAGNNTVNIFMRSFLTLDFPSGILYFNSSFIDPALFTFNIGVYMGGTTFNLA